MGGGGKTYFLRKRSDSSDHASTSPRTWCTMYQQCIKKSDIFLLWLCCILASALPTWCRWWDFFAIWIHLKLCEHLFVSFMLMIIWSFLPSRVWSYTVFEFVFYCWLLPEFSSSSGRLTMSVTYGIEGPINHATVHGGLYSGFSLSRYNSTSENWYSQSWGQSWLYLSRRTVQILGVVPSHISTIHLWGKHPPLLSESYLALTSWHLDIFRGDTRWINFDQDTPLCLMCLFYQPYLVKSIPAFVNK